MRAHVEKVDVFGWTKSVVLKNHCPIIDLAGVLV